MGRKKLGEIFMDLKLLTDEQLNHALSGASQNHMKIGQFLVQNGIVEGGQLIDALCRQLKVVKYSPDIYPLDDSLASMIPFEISQKHQVVPLSKCGRLISLAMVDPMDIKALDSVEGLIDAEVEPVICTEGEISQLINNMYSPRSRIGGVLENEESDTETVDNKIEGENGLDEDVRVTEEMADEPTVVRLVNRILDQAVREGASDVHISPQKNSIQLRFRLDGKLHDMQDLPKTLFQSLVARLKVLSKMDITLTRVPQDGRFTLRVHKKEINVRVSSVPLIYGENIVLRLLDMSTQIYSLDRLGMNVSDENIMREMVNKPHGMILSAGPAGSGKSTTLYALLNEINKPDINIITLEDPVEYRIDNIRQIQLNNKAGMTFANGLKSVLRQDPDVIMVGEIRDRETANIAVQAALTGHRVLSTVHTNDSAGAVTRLTDMGIEFFLISSVLLVTFSQRLVRTICEHCKEPYKPPKEVLVAWGLDKVENANFQHGKGCNQCMNSGYKGRTAIFEILVNDDMIKTMIAQKKTPLEITNEAVAAGKLITLKEAAIDKVINGITTIEDAASVVMH
jgi:type IV pilus assembly protein PilB